MPEEQLLWKGSPSQKPNIGFFLLTFILIIPPIIRWLKTRSTVYEVTTQRIIFHSGIFTKRREELEMYRVKDYTLVAPFLYRMFGLENLILRTSDRSSPDIVLHAVPKEEGLFDKIRAHVEAARDRKRVREVDYDAEPGA